MSNLVSDHSDASGPSDAPSPAEADERSDAAADALDALARRALALVPAGGGRAVVGIAGSPGAGKTTLAVQLAARVNAIVAAEASSASGSSSASSSASASEAASAAASPHFAAHLPMDGYHLANSTLDSLGRRDRKGAIDTFDGWGFVALLRRLHAETSHTVYAPSFDRTVEEPIAGEIAVLPDTKLVIVEGNYLLVDETPWADVKGLLAEAWFCETTDDERVRRLVDRHERHGRTPEAAKAWAESVDGKNAILIESTMPRADLVVSGVTAAVLPR
ncbi:nucleoside/nucleotide kinase family protein [Leifsonia sp. ALI-44-B]|uniref:nucleoside/nucleotide kinase family protein n=1 Tax=Leifsonia sp. ALI-44-B TaxID=1933776 RepID=UPI00097BB39A|nr:nucleoside/nucleotide kinase family protein [Leifsonia sp. ALI-44-B]ONI60521.1 nucleoside/nucleotide kinase family protein [Leifsonia sp. ALI-44-B]